MLDIADDELIIDNFAGGGGASLGIEMALGRGPDIAINHDAEAVAMHTANHPHTHHLCEDIWDVNPRDLVRKPDGGMHRIALVWLSPDCKHFSKAKGGKPVDKKVRGLAWTALRYASLPAPSKPRVMMLENVEEFVTWGPLIVDAEGNARPDPKRKGHTFNSFVNALRRQGFPYIEWRERRAYISGAGTIRKRLYMIIRSDRPVRPWAPVRYGDPKTEAVATGAIKPWKVAADCIDWSKPCVSIFLNEQEAKAAKVKRPLATPTQARMARGLDRFVLKSAKPFIVPLTHQGSDRVNSIDEPMRTVTNAHRGEMALVAPVLSYAQQGGGNRPADEPAHTICASNKDQNQLLVASLLRTDMTSAADRNGIHKPDEPIRTATTANPFALQTAVLVPYNGDKRPGESRARQPDQPLATQPTENRFALMTAHLMTMRNAQKPYNEADKPVHTITAGGAGLTLVTGQIVKFRGDSKGSPLDAPLPTATAGPAENPAGAAHALGVSAVYLAQHNAGWNDTPARDAADPLSTISAKGSQQQVVAAYLSHAYGSNTNGGAGNPDKPLKTVTADGNHHFIGAAYLTKYYTEGGTDQGLDEPLHTSTTKPRFGASQADMAQETLLTEEQRYAAWWVARWFDDFVPEEKPQGWPNGVPAPRRAMLSVTLEGGAVYAVVDIGMRMLLPRELYRAQGFPDSYIIEVMVPRRIGKKTVMRPLPADAQNRMCGNSVCPTEARDLVLSQFDPANDNEIPIEYAEAV